MIALAALRRPGSALVLLAASLPLAATTRAQDAPPAEKPADKRVEKPVDKSLAIATAFDWPCDHYARGLRRGGNFGALIPRRHGPPFGGTWHLAEDVWRPAGTEVRSVADGVVRYSDFSPTWTDGAGRVHWNLGNVIVIEHRLPDAAAPLRRVCSVYVHLGKDRLVQTGDRVRRGQPIGVIGADRSKENGRYPAHLHFGLHKGPYYQLSPACKRQALEEARTCGLPVDDQAKGMRLHRGEVLQVDVVDDTTVVYRFANGVVSCMSLEVGSSSPRYHPADIIGWCEGYGDEQTVADWLRPSTWIRAHLPRVK